MKVLKIIGNVAWYGFLTAFGLVIAKFLFHFLFYLGLIFMSVMNMGGETELVEQYEFKIEAMQDNHTYVIHRHSGDSELRYYFMRYRDGALRSGSTKASDSSIIEDGGNKVVVYYEKPVRFQKLYDFLVKMSDFGQGGDTFYFKHYQYHIPKDSVKTEFNVDLK